MEPRWLRHFTGATVYGGLAAAVCAAWLYCLVQWPGLSGYRAAYAVTALLTVGAFIVAAWRLFVERGVPALMAVFLPVLFGVLSFQTYAAFGPQHYHLTPRAAPQPGWGDWAAYVLIHLLRAADFCDAAEEYGLAHGVLPVRHAGALSGTLLVAMHWAADLFLIGLLGLLLRRVARRRAARRADGPTPERPGDPEEPRSAETAGAPAAPAAAASGDPPEPPDLPPTEPVQKLALFRRLAYWSLVPCAVAYAACAALQEWAARDWLLWPLDNLVRVLDLGDMLQVYGWQLHGVPDGQLLSTLEVAFRLSLGGSLAGLVAAARMRWFRGAGLTLDDLLPGLQSTDADERAAAAWVLLGQNRFNVGLLRREWGPVLVAALDDSELPVRRAAALYMRVLPELPPGADAALGRALTDRYDIVRDAVVVACGDLSRDFGAAALAETARAAVAALRHQHAGVRAGAARAVAELWQAAPPEAAGRLLESLGDADGTVRAAAASALREVRAPAGRAVPRLTELLGDEDRWARMGAASALGRFGAEAAGAVGPLVEALRDEDEWVRAAAATALGEIGPAARAAAGSRLTGMANDGVGVAALAAARALKKIG